MKKHERARKRYAEQQARLIRQYLHGAETNDKAIAVAEPLVRGWLIAKKRLPAGCSNFDDETNEYLIANSYLIPEIERALCGK